VQWTRTQTKLPHHDTGIYFLLRVLSHILQVGIALHGMISLHGGCPMDEMHI